MLFREIIGELEKNEIKYLIIGGVAVNLYGHPRVTKDLDIMISFEKQNMDKFIDVMNRLNFKPRAPVDPVQLADKSMRDLWKNEKNMKVFSFYNAKNDFEIIDVMIQDYIDFDLAYEKRQSMSDGVMDVSVVDINDLIRLKEIANRPRDKDDIEVLKKLKELKAHG
jgi:predicted nucleotidyltransferase